MPCLTEEKKKKYIDKDIFQTSHQEPSELGAVLGFIVLPIFSFLICFYYIGQWASTSKTDSVTRTAATENICSPFNFSCDSTYGCEITPFGNLTMQKLQNLSCQNIAISCAIIPPMLRPTKWAFCIFNASNNRIPSSAISFKTYAGSYSIFIASKGQTKL